MSPFAAAPAFGRAGVRFVTQQASIAPDREEPAPRSAVRDPWPSLLDADPGPLDDPVLGRPVQRELERLARIDREQRAR
jgi:hypothetical protein